MRGLRALLLAFVVSPKAVALCSMPVHATTIYRDSTLLRETPRLQRAVTKIFKQGIKPELRSREQAGLANIRFKFPIPQTNDHVLNFYAGEIEGAAAVVLPLQSLKMVEDLTTAFACLYVNKSSFGALDLYFAMLQRKTLDSFRPAGTRGILNAIGAPQNVPSDKLSLSVCNEAFAFVLVHELGHLLFKHTGLADITRAQARADEVQSDAFALDVLARSGTPPLGAALFFQAQIFSLPHRGEHKTTQDGPAADNLRKRVPFFR